MTSRQHSTPDDRMQVTVRLLVSLVREFRHLAVDLRCTQGAAMEILLREALEARRGEGREEARWT